MGIIVLALVIKYAHSKYEHSIEIKQDTKIADSTTYLGNRDYQKVIDTLGRVDSYPESKSTQVYFMLGQSYYALKNFSQAREDYLKLLGLQKMDAQKGFYENIIANIYRDEGNTDKAIEYYTLATGHNPKNSTGWINLSYLYLGQGNKAKALEVINSAIDKNPTDPELAKTKTAVEK